MHTFSFLRAIEVALMGSALFASACSSPSDPAMPHSQSGEAPQPSAQPPQLSRVTADRSDLLYRYRGESGTIEQTTSLDAIPEGARANVMVIDLSRSPEERGASNQVQVFDLRVPNEAGEFPGRFVPRASLEKELAAQQQFVAPPPQVPITLYATSWCPHCRHAREFMKQHNLQYTEKDVEKTPGAQAEIAAKAKKQGVDASGVPVFDVGGKIISGFDGPTLLKLARPGRTAPPASTNAPAPSRQAPTLPL